VAFVYGGDIYTVSDDGGVAQRLTSHEGQELYPKFSPDGQWIAFSAEYSGTRQVWVMPAAGGHPRQLTFYTDVGPMPPRGGTDYRVLDWTPDGKHILVRANRTPYGERDGMPMLVPFEGGMERRSVRRKPAAACSPPTATSTSTRPIDREFRTWKRHRGGRAQDVWTYDLVNNTSRQLTDFRRHRSPADVGRRTDLLRLGPRLHAQPVRHGLDGGNVRKVTEFDDFDVLWPSSDRRRIVFEQGGYMCGCTTRRTGDTRRIPIEVRGDRPHARCPRSGTSPRRSRASTSPHRASARYSARAARSSPCRQSTARSAISRARPRPARSASPGRRTASGFPIFPTPPANTRSTSAPQDGNGEPRRVTHDGSVWRFPPTWSPDSTRLAYADSANRLHVVEVDSGRIRQVDSTRHTNNAFRDLTQYVWSPDSQWLAYTKVNESYNSSIWVYSLRDGRARS
jgi:tricorn protease